LSFMRQPSTNPPHTQGFLDALEGALGDLRQSKLAVHDVFFRAMEAHEDTFHRSCQQLGACLQ